MSYAKTNSLPLAANHNLDRKFCKNDSILHNISYAEAIDSLMYVMVCTRPDLTYAISVLSQFMMEPRQEHWNAIKGVFRYIKGTLNYGLEFSKFTDSVRINSHTDSDFAKDYENILSISSYIFNICGNCIS